MANSNEEQKKTIQPQQPSKVEPDINQQMKASFFGSKYLSLIISLTSLLAFLAIIVSIYSIQLEKQFQNHQLVENKNLTDELERIKAEQNTVQKLLDNNTNHLQQIQSDLTSKMDSLNKELQTAMKQKLYQNNDWLLLKARYYLELAQINVHWSDNFNTSVALLQQADALLKGMNIPQIFTIRQTIAKEIAQLKSISVVDITGILSQLDAAQAAINNLSIQSVVDQQEVLNHITKSEESGKTGWRNRLQDSVNFLEKLVVIRRHNENIQPLISPLYESAIKENIRLNLQEAQWAILNNNPAVYQFALNQAIANLKRVFNDSSQNTDALIKQLSTLQNVKLTQEKPVVGQAIPLINQMIDNKELLVDQANSKKGEN
ncbi:Putative uroporphyrinogen-III C-methyltransferase [Legionella pneumophila]|uniref:Uroporphyrinogen III methylase n=1 Tax=Legionella pneumophila subsp. pneumophila TaxID=91891 RepID=A0AAV2V0H9_LEGPN|nr:uroporphyrinogen-III C-methyltransferase [Legionella pneumophila]MCK1848348.1 uroporphyrinogen-III C-methyltransferase [Legionella pneumophila]MCZ4804940.1 uroporphyrinogen-III C-methyltransferase [Legionella pneumophila]MDI9850436.1 uroporphyrinogen-III C-methyltransferase [Legionella pneumophila]MDW8866016.1 uroporphyrinogen-III C-methyltransferase [Legionella pneumophila]MDW8967981.1 uroporphyrinogen-III C-methyltransferase [Legionella pneumophila]